MFFRLLGPFSLKARFTIGASFMLAPMVILAIGSFLALDHASRQMEEVVEEALQEDMPIVHLQKEIHRANMEGHDLLMSGTLIAREEFRVANQEVERDFQDLLKDAPFKMDEEHRYLGKAHEIWRVQAEELLAFAEQRSSGQETETMYKAMESFDAGLEQTLFQLDRVRSVAREEIDQRAALAYRAKAQMLVVVVIVFLLGFIIAVGGGFALARSVLIPVHDIETGVERIAAGDFSHRVLVSTKDELGELAKAVNRMGEQLLQSDRALNEGIMHDELTGLYTAREFNDLLSMEVNRSWRYNRPFSVILADIDGFSDFNASFGREAGDVVLKEVAEVIQKEVREVDRVARYGHDEFAIILTEVKGPGAEATARRLMDAARKISFSVPGDQTRSLSLSAGVAEYGKEHGTEDTIIIAAEQALREARVKGGNAIVVS